jgi:hypothetical protein
MCIPAQLGCCRAAPFRPHLVQRADYRSRSLEASGPHLMMNGTNATGMRCMQYSQTTQHQGVPRRSCSRVGRGGSDFMSPRMALFAPEEQPRGVVASSAGMAYILGIAALAWCSLEVQLRS